MKEKSQKDEGLKVTFQVQIALRVHLLGKCGIYPFPSYLTGCQLPNLILGLQTSPLSFYSR